MKHVKNTRSKSIVYMLIDKWMLFSLMKSIGIVVLLKSNHYHPYVLYTITTTIYQKE